MRNTLFVLGMMVIGSVGAHYAISARDADKPIAHASILVPEGDSWQPMGPVTGIGNYVKRSGDTMFGTLRINNPTNTTGLIFGTDAIGGGNNRYLCWGGSTCTYYNGVDMIWSGTAYWSGYGFSSGGNAAPGVRLTGTSWIEMAGDTSANIQASVPAAGSGAFNYDDTNTRMRVYEGVGKWDMIPSFNPDGGAPFGLVLNMSGSTFTTVVGVRFLAFASFQLPVQGEVISYTSLIAGAGAGNAVLTLQQGGTLCTGNVACALAAGSSSAVACNVNVPAANTKIGFDTSACTAGSAPQGNAVFTYHPNAN